MQEDNPSSRVFGVNNKALKRFIQDLREDGFTDEEIEKIFAEGYLPIFEKETQASNRRFMEDERNEDH